MIVQPSMTTPLVQPERRRRPEIGLVALVLAIISTALFAICGCWWALPCAVVGIILGATVSNACMVLGGGGKSLDMQLTRMFI